MVYQTQCDRTELKMHQTTQSSDDMKGANGAAGNVMMHKRVTETRICGNAEEHGKHTY